MIKVIFAPGNGGGGPQDNWFPYLKEGLQKLKGVQVIASEFPDNILARASFWLPFLKETLKADAQTIIVGHSSGAIAAMRLAEEIPLLGSVLVGAYLTHLNIEAEKISGYFDRPWDFDAIKKNQRWIIQFASCNDPWIPIEEARAVHQNLQTEYYESSDQGHFGGDYYKKEFPELLKVLTEKIQIKLKNTTACYNLD